MKYSSGVSLINDSTTAQIKTKILIIYPIQASALIPSFHTLGMNLVSFQWL
jgi:hypothetical protein